MNVHENSKNKGGDNAYIAMLVNIPKDNAHDKPIGNPGMVTPW
jgi:hypothetical protein